MADPAHRGRGAYALAGVDVQAGEDAVRRMRQRVSSHGADLLGSLGGFAAATALPAGLVEPVLVTATDGVGTKTEIARRMLRYDTIGQDLVAMCVDDVVCHGARPWLFLDYLAVGRLDGAIAAELVAGVGRACDAVDCRLVGGETAEHPGVMEPDAFDVAGFCIGIAEREQLVDGSAARAGDAVIGLAASGLHSNGFSLVRAIMARHGLDVTTPLDEVERRAGELGDVPDAVDPRLDPTWRTLGDALLEPTRLHAKAVLGLRDHLASAGTPLRGVAHITGGGLAKNVPRAVGPDVGVVVDPQSWEVPWIVATIAALGGLDGPEMRATFNGGIGMAMVVAPSAVDDALGWLEGAGAEAWRIGRVVDAADAGPTRYRETAS